MFSKTNLEIEKSASYQYLNEDENICTNLTSDKKIRKCYKKFMPIVRR